MPKRSHHGNPCPEHPGDERVEQSLRGGRRGLHKQPPRKQLDRSPTRQAARARVAPTRACHVSSIIVDRRRCGSSHIRTARSASSGARSPEVRSGAACPGEAGGAGEDASARIPLARANRVAAAEFPQARGRPVDDARRGHPRRTTQGRRGGPATERRA